MLKELIDQYFAKMSNLSELIKEKQLIEEKIGIIKGERSQILGAIAKHFKKTGSKGVKTFFVEHEGEKYFCSIDLDYHPQNEGFIIFHEIYSLAELEAQPDDELDSDSSQYEELKYNHHR